MQTYIKIIKNVLMKAPAKLKSLGSQSRIIHQGSGWANLENDTEIEADQKMGEWFLKELQKYPDEIGRVVIEGKNPVVLSESVHTAYVDPLDASLQYHLRNGTHGMAYSAVITIVCDGGKQNLSGGKFSDIIAGGVVDLRFTNPIDIWVAQRGKGAYVNGHMLIHAATGPYKFDLSKGQLAIMEMYYSDTRKLAAQMALGKDGYIRSPGSAALEMVYVSNGMAQVHLCLSQKCHELGAGYIINKEAGRYIATIDNNFRPQDIDNVPFIFNSKLPVITACNKRYALSVLKECRKAYPKGFHI